ncbi:MAG: hypothetical protein Q8Q06_04255 [bacterium]|nr:hypothetical protein [bacterium]
MEIKRKQNESTGAMLRRFSRLIQQSKYLKNAEKKKYRYRKENERKEKNRAIMREHLRLLRKKLDKLGVYGEESFHEEKRKLKQKLGI